MCYTQIMRRKLFSFDKYEVILWIISNQLSRRNLTAFERSELALRLKPKLEAEAKERMEAGNNQYSPVEKLPQGGKVRDQLGELAGVSGKTIDNVEKILNKGTEKDIQEVRTGKASISGKAKGECVKYV